MAEVAPSRPDISAELEQARLTFARLVADASPADLRRGSRGTRWTNEQLLFHMLFGYLVVRTLLPLVKLMGRVPDPVSFRFSRLLDAVAAPFHAINYQGSCVGAVVFGHRRMRRRMDAVIISLQRHLDRETDESMALRMRFPTRWDPFFTDCMTVADVYHYATEHFEYHRQQLTLDHSG